MKTNKLILLASIIIIAVFTYLGFIVSELTQFNDITTNDVVTSNAVHQAIQFHTIKILLCLLLIGYICIEIKGYYDHQKELKNIKGKVKDFADFLAMNRGKLDSNHIIFGQERKQGKSTIEDIFAHMKKDVVFDKKVQDRPRREDYPLSNEGFEQWQTAMNEWNDVLRGNERE